MTEETVATNSNSDAAAHTDVSPKLLRKIRKADCPMVLLRLCLKGGKPLIQSHSKLPRRILRLALGIEGEKKADKARLGVAQHFPDSLGKKDLAWLQEQGLKEQEIQTIRKVVSDDRVTASGRIRLIERLYDLREYERLSEAFDDFASEIVDDPKFCKAHYVELIRDRRASDAQTVLDHIKKKFGATAYYESFEKKGFFGVEGDVGFETIPDDTSPGENTATATHRLNKIAKKLDEGDAEQIEGWRRLESGIIYRKGALDTALIIYTGPQTLAHAEAFTQIINTCNQLGIGQVLLHRRLDRCLTGLGPWKGRPEVTIRFLAEALQSVGIARLATVGASGTSLTATIAGAEIDAAGVLLLPAVTHFPDPEKEPNPRAARSAARQLRLLPPGEYDARPFLQGKSVPVWAHLPEKSEFDRRQIDHLADYPYLNVIAHDCEKHGILAWLAQQEQLDPAVSEFFNSLGWIDQ
jgi:hypothetical protein